MHKIGKENPVLGAAGSSPDEDGNSPDVTAFVSALANQQSEEELEVGFKMTLIKHITILCGHNDTLFF